jgi:hypothetical protein
MKIEKDSQRLQDLKAYFENENLENLIWYRDKHRFVAEEEKLLNEVIAQKLYAEVGVPSSPVIEAPAVDTPLTASTR